MSASRVVQLVGYACIIHSLCSQARPLSRRPVRCALASFPGQYVGMRLERGGIESDSTTRLVPASCSACCAAGLGHATPPLCRPRRVSSSGMALSDTFHYMECECERGGK